MLQSEKSQKGACEHLQCARDDPARPGHQQCGPPALAVAPGLFRQKAQVVDLFANLRDQRQGHGAGGAEVQQVERAAFAFTAGEAGPVTECFGVFADDEDVGQEQQKQPQRLGPHLQSVDQGDAVGHQRDDDHRADYIGQCQWDVEVQLQRQGHDRRLKGEEQEGEAGVDQ